MYIFYNTMVKVLLLSIQTIYLHLVFFYIFEQVKYMFIRCESY